MVRTVRFAAIALALVAAAASALPALAEEKKVKGLAAIFEDEGNPQKKVFTVTVETEMDATEYTVVCTQEQIAEVEKAMTAAKSEEIEVTGEVGKDKEGRPTITLKSYKVLGEKK